jgi:hypothetical protein
VSGERTQRMLELVETWNSGGIDAYLVALGPDFEFAPDPSFPDSGILRGEKLRAWVHEWSEIFGRTSPPADGALRLPRNGRLIGRAAWRLRSRDP